MKALWQFIRRLWRRVLEPSLVQASVAAVVGCMFIAAAIVFSSAGENNAGAYICYALALLSLVYIGYICAYGFPKVKQRTLEVFSRNSFADRLIKNYGFRTIVLAFISIVLNGLYAIYNGALAIFFGTFSGMLFAAYYLLLCALRGAVLSCERRHAGTSDTGFEHSDSVKLYVRCGIVLVVFTFIIVAAMIRIIISEGREAPPGYLIYVSALYTFVRFGFSVYNIRKAKQFNDFGIKALRNIGFADALVSLFILQMALISVFGGVEDLHVFNAVTGAAVCGIIIFMGIYMAVTGTRELKTED